MQGRLEGGRVPQGGSSIAAAASSRDAGVKERSIEAVGRLGRRVARRARSRI